MELYDIQALLAIYFCAQIGYATLVLLMGFIITDYFQLIIWEKPTNIFTKTITFISYFLFGAGPYLDKKFRKYSFLKRKLYLLGCIIVMIIASVLIYYGVTALLKPILD